VPAPIAVDESAPAVLHRITPERGGGSPDLSTR